MRILVVMLTSTLAWSIPFPARADVFKSDTRDNVIPGPHDTVNLSIQCDPGQIFLTGPTLEVQVWRPVGVAPRLAVLNLDYLIGTSVVTNYSADYSVRILRFADVATNEGWDVELWGSCDQPKQKKPPRAKKVLTAFKSGLTFFPGKLIPLKRSAATTGGQVADPTPPNPITDGPTKDDGTSVNLHQATALWCDFGGGKRLTVFDHTREGDFWYYPDTAAEYDPSLIGNGRPRPPVHWKAFQFTAPGDNSVPGCAKQSPNDASERPFFSTVDVSIEDCSHYWFAPMLFWCILAGIDTVTAKVSADYWGPIAPQGNPLSVWPAMVDAVQGLQLPSVSRKLGAFNQDLQPFVYSTPTSSKLGLFEGAADANYITLSDGTKVVQKHNLYVMGNGKTSYQSPRLLLADTNGDGTTEVNYLGQRYDDKQLELTTFNGVPGKWDIQVSTAPVPAGTSIDSYGWMLTDPPVQVEPQAALELRSAVAGTWGWNNSAHPCIDIWAGGTNYATGIATCPAITSGYQASVSGVVDRNFASIFQMNPIPGSDDASLVYFQSIVDGGNQLCLSLAAGTTINLAPCNTSDGSQMWELLNKRADGAVELRSVRNGLCAALRNDGPNGINAYAPCVPNSDYLWWYLQPPAAAAA